MNDGGGFLLETRPRPSLGESRAVSANSVLLTLNAGHGDLPRQGEDDSGGEPGGDMRDGTGSLLSACH